MSCFNVSHRIDYLVGGGLQGAVVGGHDAQLGDGCRGDDPEPAGVSSPVWSLLAVPEDTRPGAHAHTHMHARRTHNAHTHMRVHSTHTQAYMQTRKYQHNFTCSACVY